MTDLKPRLLSPNKLRLYPNARSGAGIDTAGELVKTWRAGLSVGEPDVPTWINLKQLGWTEYTGPARTDERGYIIAGTDPAISEGNK